MSKRIGILLTSNDPSEFAKRYPNDGEKFRKLLDPIRPDWEFVTVPVKDDIFPDNPFEFDGYVITGSPASVHDKDPWIARLLDFIRELVRLEIPLVGACFGHQAIALALGGKVEKNNGGWSFGIEETSFDVELPWIEGERPSLKLYSAHKEQVTQLPDGAERVGGNAFCPLGAYVIGNYVFTTEYHPEMTPDFMIGLVDEMRDILGEEGSSRALTQLQNAAEGPVFAKWMIAFFEYPRAKAGTVVSAG